MEYKYIILPYLMRMHLTFLELHTFCMYLINIVLGGRGEEANFIYTPSNYLKRFFLAEPLFLNILVLHERNKISYFAIRSLQVPDAITFLLCSYSCCSRVHISIVVFIYISVAVVFIFLLQSCSYSCCSRVHIPIVVVVFIFLLQSFSYSYCPVHTSIVEMYLSMLQTCLHPCRHVYINTGVFTFSLQKYLFPTQTRSQ